MALFYTIGVDIGTGSAKAVAVDYQGNVLFSTQTGYATLAAHAGYREQDAEAIWTAFLKIVNETVSHCTVPPQSISLSSAMHSIMAVDSLGKPLMNMIIWADNRSASIAKRVRQLPGAESLYRHTGTPIHAMSPLCKLIWLGENEPHLFNNAVKFISIKEFIWYKLFNVFEVDYAIASATGLFDIGTLQWHDAALALANITAHKLSCPVQTNHKRRGVEVIAGLTDVLSTTTFVIGGSDGCMANLGSFATKPGVAALTIGTSGAIRVGSKVPVFNFQAMTFNYILDEHTFVSGGPVNNGGIALKWFVEGVLHRTLASAADYATLLGEIKDVEPGCEGLIFLPYVLGERAPIWNSSARGMFFGLTGQHSQRHLTRAVVEGITMALYHVAAELAQTGLVIEKINVSGGFVHSAAWLQILANIFNKQVCLVSAEDASALGAAYLALKATGVVNDYSQLQPKHVVTYLPDVAQHHIYQKNFELYKLIYSRLHDVM